MTQKSPETFFNHQNKGGQSTDETLFSLFGDFIQLRLTPYLLIEINDCLRHPISTNSSLLYNQGKKVRGIYDKRKFLYSCFFHGCSVDNHTCFNYTNYDNFHKVQRLRSDRISCH